jgi:hypothetical protein
MKELIKAFIFGSVFALILLPPLHAQTAAKAPADSNAAANPTPPGQAPEEMTKKIADLVHAGKYPEAQRLTTGLLVAYPDDQRLVKAESLIEKLIAPAPSGSATPGNNPLKSDVAANPDADQLTGMDRVDYDALIELGRQAQQSTDLEQQTKLLKQFMTDSRLFLQKHPNEIMLWHLRAASAIILDDPIAGYEAGQRLLATASNDANVRRLLAQLKNKGWLEKEAGQHRYILVTFVDDTAGTDKAPSVGDVNDMLAKLRVILERDETVLLQSRFSQRDVLTIPDVHAEPTLKVTVRIQSASWHYRGIWNPPFFVDSKLSISVSSPKGLNIDRTFKLAIKRKLDDKEMSSYMSSGSPVFSVWIAGEVMADLKNILDEDAVRLSLSTIAPNP